MNREAAVGSPDGHLGDGTPYFGKLGELAFDPDEDKVQCHLCGGWYRFVGSSHLRITHGWSLRDYREAFQLYKNISTISAGLRGRKREAAREELSQNNGFGVPTQGPPHNATSLARWRSLAVRRPDLATELHPTRNGDLDPYQLGARSSRKVWWRCSDCGHEWQTAVCTRNGQDSGCPRCAAKRVGAMCQRVARERSLAVRHPDLAGELHPTRNADLDPYQLGARSSRKVWWRCAECGHEWEAAPARRTRGGQCPQCSARRRGGKQRGRPASERSLAALRPDLVAELHPTRNADLDPSRVAAGSDRKIWWRCRTCGHEWRTAVNDRIRYATGCPRCAAKRCGTKCQRVAPERSLAVRDPDLAGELHPTRNADLDPYELGARSSRKVWWRCAGCGHEWQATPNNRGNGDGCPECTRTQRAARLDRARVPRGAG